MSSTHHQLAATLLSGVADVLVLAGHERLGVITFVTEGVAKSRDTETFRLVLYADPKCVLCMFQQEISAALLGVRIICIMH